MNILKELKPRRALNKAFLKVEPNRTEIEGFKSHFITLLDRTNDTESIAANAYWRIAETTGKNRRKRTRDELSRVENASC